MAGHNRKIISLNSDAFDFVKATVLGAAFDLAKQVHKAGLYATPEMREQLCIARRAVGCFERPLDVDATAETGRLPCIIEGPAVLDVLDNKRG